MNEPFIKLIRTPNSRYFYDVNHSDLIAIGDEVYEYLENIQRDASECALTEEAAKEIEILRDNGYLQPNPIKNLFNPVIYRIGEILDRCVSMLILQVTQNCNFRCTYCTYTSSVDHKQRSHSNKRMSFSTAKKAIDFLAEHSVECKTITLGFYGGEPLLEIDLIKKCVEYAERLFEGKELIISLTTNVSLLTDEIVQYFIDHNISILMSIDGIKEIHDKNRKYAPTGEGTYDIVIDRLKHISDKFPDFMQGSVRVNMVVDPQNDYRKVHAIQQELEKVGISPRQINSSIVDKYFIDEKTTYSAEYQKYLWYDEFLSSLYYLKLLETEPDNKIVLQSKNEFYYRLQQLKTRVGLGETHVPGGPCIPGIFRLFVDADGTFFPCERVSETSEAMKIGSVHEGFNIEKVKNLLNVGKLNEEMCISCWAMDMCSVCCKYVDCGTCLDGNLKKKACMNVRADMYYKLYTLAMLDEVGRFYRKDEAE